MIYQFSLSSLTFCNYHAMEKLYKYLIFMELGSFTYEKNVLELGKKCAILCNFLPNMINNYFSGLIIVIIRLFHKYQ